MYTLPVSMAAIMGMFPSLSVRSLRSFGPAFINCCITLAAYLQKKVKCKLPNLPPKKLVYMSRSSCRCQMKTRLLLWSSGKTCDGL
jgi:hypothetical protein